MAKKVSKEDLDLLGELGVDTAPKKQAARTPKEQRIIAGYEEIERFVEEHGRLPEHGENGDIFERLYACLLYTSPSPRDQRGSRMPSSA